MPPKIKVDVNLAKLSPQTTEALINDPLDDVEIRNALGSDAKIIPYHELKNYRSMDELLPKPKDAAMLLYENSPMNGHWVCLTKNKGEISFFDPYGEIVDKQLQYSKYSKDRVEGGADQSLHQLLSTSRLPVYFNDYKYQRDGGDVNTCGRHTINFIRYNQRHGLDLEDYNEMMKKTQKKSGLPYDELISKMVPIYLPKGGEATGEGRPLNARNKTCAEKFLECVKAKMYRKVRGDKGNRRYDPDVKLPEFGIETTNPHLTKLASLAITGKDNYAAAQKLVEEVKKNMTPDEREALKQITQEDLRRVAKVKPYRMKSAAKHKYNLARQMEVIGGDELEAAIRRGLKRFPRHQVPYDVKGRKDGRIIIQYQSTIDGKDKEVLLPLVFVFEEDTRPATLYDPEDGKDAGNLYVGKKKEKRTGYRGNEYEVEVNDPENLDASLDFDWLRGLHKRQKDEELRAKVSKPPTKEQLEAARGGFDPEADYEAQYNPKLRLWYIEDADRAFYYLPESKYPHSAKTRKVRVSEEELVQGKDVEFVGRRTEDNKFAIEGDMRKWWAAYKKKHNIQL